MKAVLTFGIYTVEQYARAPGKRHLSGVSVSYGLLKIDRWANFGRPDKSRHIP
jgi:hypothetical protein